MLLLSVAAKSGSWDLRIKKNTLDDSQVHLQKGFGNDQILTSNFHSAELIVRTAMNHVLKYQKILKPIVIVHVERTFEGGITEMEKVTLVVNIKNISGSSGKAR